MKFHVFIFELWDDDKILQGISKASDAPEDRKSFESKATEVKEMDHDLEEDLGILRVDKHGDFFVVMQLGWLFLHKGFRLCQTDHF